LALVGTVGPPLALLSIVLILVVGTVVAVSAVRMDQSDAPVGADPRSATGLDGPILKWSALAFAVAAWGIGVWITVQLRPSQDDFRYLIQAVHAPWDPDPGLRYLSRNVLYRLAVGTGDPRYTLVVANVAAYLTAGACFYQLVRRAGQTTSTALVASALFATAPGYYDNLTAGVGFQTNGAIALTHGALLLVDMAATTHNRRRGVGLFLIASAVVATGVLVKFPMMGLVPIMAWVWARFVVRRAVPPFSTVVPYVALGVALLILLVALQPEAEVEKAGVERLGENLARMGQIVAGSTVRWAAPVIFALAVGSFAGWRRRGRGGATADPSMVSAQTRELGRRRTVAFFALALLGALPFLFNRLYFAPYYAITCWTWLCPMLAVPFVEAIRRAERVAGGAAGSAAIGLLGYLAVGEPGHRGRMVTWKLTSMMAVEDGLRELGKAHTAPCEIVMTAACEGDAATAAAVEELRAFYIRGEEDMGVRWYTGWHDADVEVQGTPAKREHMTVLRGEAWACAIERLDVSYCSGRFTVVDAAAPGDRHDP
jgi:hypothetical protein